MDERIPDKVVIVRCGSEQQKSSRILHIFTAGQFKRNFRPGNRNMHPRPGANDESFWCDRFRLRLDGRWLGTSGCKYHFYSSDELTILVAGLVAGQI